MQEAEESAHQWKGFEINHWNCWWEELGYCRCVDNIVQEQTNSLPEWSGLQIYFILNMFLLPNQTGVQSQPNHLNWVSPWLEMHSTIPSNGC